MEPDYSATLLKAKTYFNKMLKDREKHMLKMPADLPKRIEIETLPVSGSRLAHKAHETETKHHRETEQKNHRETEAKNPHQDGEMKRRPEFGAKNHLETEPKQRPESGPKSHRETEPPKHRPESGPKNHRGIETKTRPESAPKNQPETETKQRPESAVKHRESESKHHSETENNTKPKQKVTKKKSGSQAKQPKLKVKSFELRNMNENSTLDSKTKSSSKSLMNSSSISTNESPVSTSLKISTSSSTARINQRCYEAIQKAKNYFEKRDNAKFRKKPPTFLKANERYTGTKIDENKQTKVENVVYSVEISKKNTSEELGHKRGKGSLLQKKENPSARKHLRSQMGIDQKSINVKKDNKAKTEITRNSTKIKTYLNAAKESRRASRSPSPQLNIVTVDQISDHLTPAKRYLRSKLGMDEKAHPNMKRDSTKNATSKPATPEVAARENKTETQPESSKHGTKLNTNNAIKVRPPFSTRPYDTETNLKKFTPAHENQAKDNHQTKSSIKTKASFCTKTSIVTSIEPYYQTNKLSIELKKPITLTISKEKLIAKALKIGLQKVNCTGLQDLQIKINSSNQSRNNVTGGDQYVHSDRADMISMQSLLESKISAFQTEMDRRQKHTFDKIQELENTIQFRKQQLLEVNKSKNKAYQNYERTKS